VRFRKQQLLIYIGLGALLAGVIILSLMYGAVTISGLQVLAILSDSVKISLPISFTPLEQNIILYLRLPRVLLAVVVGAGLATSGTVMQGLFRNPLAEPGLLGIASGAALAAAAVTVLGKSLWLGVYTLPLAAFAGSLVTSFLVYGLAHSNSQRTSVATLLLAGIAINALAGALINLLVYLASTEQLRILLFWSMGSLGNATWTQVLIAAPLIGIVTVSLPVYGRGLNVLLLGEAEAQYLGFNVERMKRTLLMLVALSVGTAVAVAGTIAFIGLIVPHWLRLWIGSDHQRLLPATALLGASLLVSADLLARLVIAPAELPIGVITALLGAPFFLGLLWQQRGQFH